MGAEVVPLVGVYSTEAHPFCIVYEYLDGLDVKKYMKGEPNADKLELVLIPIYPNPAIQQSSDGSR